MAVIEHSYSFRQTLFLALILLIVASSCNHNTEVPGEDRSSADARSSRTQDKTYLTIVGNTVSIRDIPSLEGQQLFQVKKGEEIPYTESSSERETIQYFGTNYWYKIHFGGQEGWVYGGLTSLAQGGIYGQGSGRIFDRDLALLLGEIYVKSGVLNRDYRALKRFVTTKPFLFLAENNFMKATKQLGHLALHKAIEIFDADAYKNARALGYSHHQAQEIANQINQGSSDLGRAGQELLWLADVLPAGAKGDWEPFDTTGTSLRWQVRASLDQIEQLLISESDPFWRQMLSQVFEGADDYNREYIATIAMMSGI